VLAISNSINALNDYCEKTYGKKIGKPEMQYFSWDGYYTVEETKTIII
jgi:hypothetical protein